MCALVVVGGTGLLRGLLAPCGCDLSKKGVPLYSQLASAACPEHAEAIGPAAQPLQPFPPLQHYAWLSARQGFFRCSQFSSLEQGEYVIVCVCVCFSPLPREYLININTCCCLVHIGLLLAFQVDHLSFQ